MSAPTNLQDSINYDHRCPITQDYMLDPVAAVPCGHLFERFAIEQWMRNTPSCPLDRSRIESLNPQPGLRAEIHAFIDKNPFLFDGKSARELEAAMIEDHREIPVEAQRREEIPVEDLFGIIARNGASIQVRIGEQPSFDALGQMIRYTEWSGPPIDQYVRNLRSRHNPNRNEADENEQHYALRIGDNFYSVVALPPQNRSLIPGRPLLIAFVVVSIAIIIAAMQARNL